MKNLLKQITLKRLLGLVLIYITIRLVHFAYGEIKEYIRIANLKDTASPNVQMLENFADIKSLNRKRTVNIYLPAEHDKSENRYPVIYMLDGENLFSEKVSGGDEWEVDEVIDKAVANGHSGAIVVALEDADENRGTEYTPFDPETGKDADGVKLLDYIAYELKPIIDATYKTKPEREHTGIIGASLGGIMSLYALTKYQETFGRAGIFSPSLWKSDRFYTLPEKIASWEGMRVFIAVGDQEGFMDDDAKKLYQKFLDAGIPQEQIRLSIEEGFGHRHPTWRQAFSKAFPWIVNQ